MPSDLQAVWLVRSRATSARLRFWMLLAGLDSRPRTLNDRLYLVYALAFFALWGFSLLTLVAGFAAGILALIPAAPAQSAAALALIGLLAWWLAAAWGAARRSPLLLSDADAQLLCQTPVRRPAVALTWLLTDWPEAAIPVVAVALVLGYAQVEVALGPDIGLEHLPRYLAAGLRSLSTALPLHIGLMSLAWALGAYRLEGDRERRGLRLVPLAVAGLLIVALAQAGGGQPLAGLVSPAWWAITGPLSLPLRAGLGDAPWSAGFGVALAVAVVSVLVLALASRRMSLSRAAQETRGLEALRNALLLGTDEMAAELSQRRRLGTTRRPSRLPARPGAGALAWKRAVQMSRDLTLGSATTWLMLAGSAALVALAPDPGTQAWSALVWVYFVSQVSARPLRNDLARWWLVRQVPRSAGRVLMGGLALPVVLTVIASLGAPAFAALAERGAWLPLLLMLPGVSAAVALAAALDILRRCRASDLMAGIVPGTSSLTLLLGLAAVAPPVLAYLQLSGASPVLAALAAGAAALAIAALMGRAAALYLDRVG